MLGTRDGAESKDSPIEKFKKYLGEIKKNLEEQVRLLGSDNRSVALVEQFMFLTNEKSALFKNKTYESLDEIEQVFKKIAEEFEKQCWALGVAESHIELRNTFNLLLHWYKIKAIETFLVFKPLAYEVNGSAASESKKHLKEKFADLTQKIDRFNVSITEHEQALAKIAIQLPDVSEGLRHFLQPLVKEETDPSKKFFLFYPLDKFKADKAVLEKDTEALKDELKETLNNFKSMLNKQQNERMELYDSKLEIDVYYLEEFSKDEKNKPIIKSYQNILKKKGKTELGRIKEMFDWIEKMFEPYRVFQSSLNESEAKNTSNRGWIEGLATWWDPNYYRAVNNIHVLLKKELMTLERCSLVLKLENQYKEEFGYIRNDLPKSEEIALVNFKKAAREYLKEISAVTNQEYLGNLRRKIERAKEAEIERFEQRLKPEVPLPVILPIKYHSLRREVLNKHWRSACDTLFQKELQKILVEFNKIKQKNSITSIEELSILEGDLVSLRQSIDIQIEENRCHAVSSMVSDAFMTANNHPIMKDLRSYKQKLATREVVYETQIFSDEKWYAKLIDQPWKKSTIVGLGTFLLVALALTGWGLAVEASLSVLLIATLGLSPAVGLVGGFFSYLFKECCSNNSHHIEEQELAVPSSKIIMPRPINQSFEDHKHSAPAPKQLSLTKKDDALTLGSWGFFGRFLARRDAECKIEAASLKVDANKKLPTP